MNHMTKGKKIGLLFILLGIGIPALLLFRVTGYSPQKGIIHNIYGTSIKVYDNDNSSLQKDDSKILRYIPHHVPYRFVVAIGVFLIFIGIREIDRSRYKNLE